MDNPTPIERAKNVYLEEPCARTFVEDLEIHLLGGYVFSTPSYFIMGRAVNADGTNEQIVDPTYHFEVADCWHVYLAAGENPFGEFLRLMPYELPYISWERKNRLRIYRTSWILGKIEVPSSIFSGYTAI